MRYSLASLRLPLLNWRIVYTTSKVAFFFLLLLAHANGKAATQDRTGAELIPHSTATLNCLLLKPAVDDDRAFAEQLILALENKGRIGARAVLPKKGTSVSCDYEAHIEVGPEIQGATSVTVEVLYNRRPVSEPFTTSASKSADIQLEEVANHIFTTITMNIRIQIKNFNMLGDGTTGGEYKQLEGALPNMLSHGLSVSPHIVLVDDSDSAEIMELLEKKGAPIFDQATYVDPEFLIANYTVEGDFGVLNDVLYIAVKCTNNKTKQIIVSQGIDVEPVELKVLQERVSELAAELRAAIELDYLAGQKKDKYISVVATSPFPDTKENRDIILEIAHTINRNLSVMDLEGLEVRMDMQKMRGFIENPLQQDRWIMSHQLEADYLIILDLDRTDRDNIIVTATFFDTNDPRKIDPEVFRSAPKDIDSKIIEDIIQTAEQKGWIEISEDGKDLSDIDEPFKYRGIYKTLVFNYRIGPSVRLDPDLFAGVGFGILVDLGLGWNPSKSNHWKIEPLHLRMDFLGSNDGGDRIVLGFDIIYLNVLYRLQPHYSKGFYVGAGGGYLGIIRKAPGDANLDGRPGVLLSVGLEQVLKSSRKLDWRLELAYGLDEIDPKLVGDEAFEGGRPGGIYFTLGSSF